MAHKLVNQTGFFLLSGIPQQKGAFKVVDNGDNIGLAFKGTDVILAAPIHFSEWKNELDVSFATRQDLLDAIGLYCFNVSSGAAVAEPIVLDINQPYVDQAGRIRVSESTVLGEFEFMGDKLPNVIEETGTGTGTHNILESCVEMTALAGEFLIRRTKQVYRYIPGFSQLIELTHKRFEAQVGYTKRTGYYSSTIVTPFQAEFDGLFLETVDGAAHTWQIWRAGTQVVSIARANWDDPMDGSGRSGINIDFVNFNIILQDFLWLGGKGARLVFAVGKQIVVAHEYDHSNLGTTIFTKSPNHPLRSELISTGVTTNGRFDSICGSVQSEGAKNEVATPVTENSGINALNANVIGTIYALIGMRLKTAFRFSEIKLNFATILCTTTDSYRWMIIENPVVAGAFAYVDKVDTAIEFAVGEKSNPSTSTVTGGRILAQGEVSSTSRDITIPESLNKPLLHNIDGTQVPVVLCIQPLSAGVDAFGSLNLKEKK